MAPLLRWLEARGIISISFADDLSMLGTLPSLRAVLPQVRNYVTQLGMQLNPGKSKWATQDHPANTRGADLLAFLQATEWGNHTGSLLRNLGLLVRFGSDSESGEDWDALQGQRGNVG